ncbi:DUF1538 domain-containing protein [Sphaerochaeta sp.]|uniref:DUF1538 domain-containing protein n=1 Tax=Sphaerochaeta sp. TaxID=1972642 RepID=UPI002FC60277
MELLTKLKEVGFSIAPILGLVTLLHLFVTPLGNGILPIFYGSTFLVIVGLALFLLGVDIGLLPIGERIGATVTRTKRLGALLFTGALLGVVVIVAEPNIAVLKDQVAGVNPAINTTVMVALIALGVGLYLVIGIVRVVFHLSLKWIYAISYLLLFTLAFLVPPELLGLAFDSGGAATGPLAVPFIMAFGVGIARVQQLQNDADNFGYISLALIGPTFALLLLGLLLPETTAQPGALSGIPEAGDFLTLLPAIISQVLRALLPLLSLCMVYQLLLLHMPFGQMLRIGIGFIYLFLGLTLFFLGANGGFIPVGFAIGHAIGTMHEYLLLAVGLLLGSITVLSEPSVWVLVDQVERITQGHVKKPVMLTALAIGVGISGFLAMLRIITGLPIWYFLVPSYLLAVILAFLIPDLFVGLAFDSGSVSSGPMASTFILSFAIGASYAVGGNPASDAFGIIIFVSMTPTLTVALLGLLYKRALARMANQGVHP